MISPSLIVLRRAHPTQLQFQPCSTAAPATSLAWARPQARSSIDSLTLLSCGAALRLRLRGARGHCRTTTARRPLRPGTGRRVSHLHHDRVRWPHSMLTTDVPVLVRGCTAAARHAVGERAVLFHNNAVCVRRGKVHVGCACDQRRWRGARRASSACGMGGTRRVGTYRFG